MAIPLLLCVTLSYTHICVTVILYGAVLRYNNKQVPDIFYGYFKPIQDIHDHNTRSCSGLYDRQPKTELSKFSITYRGPVLKL